MKINECRVFTHAIIVFQESVLFNVSKRFYTLLFQAFFKYFLTTLDALKLHMFYI